MAMNHWVNSPTFECGSEEFTRQKQAANGFQIFNNIQDLRNYCDSNYILRMAFVNSNKTFYSNIGKNPDGVTVDNKNYIQDRNEFVYEKFAGTGNSFVHRSGLLTIPSGGSQVRLEGTDIKSILLPPARGENETKFIVITQDTQTTSILAIAPAIDSSESLVGSTGTDSNANYTTNQFGGTSIPTGTKFYENFSPARSLILIAFDDGWHFFNEATNQAQTVNITNSVVADQRGISTPVDNSVNITTANQWVILPNSSNERVNINDVDDFAIVKIFQENPDTGKDEYLGQTTVGELKSPRVHPTIGSAVVKSGASSNIGWQPRASGGSSSGPSTIGTDLTPS